jgi:iron transport multicopper oxidase
MVEAPELLQKQSIPEDHFAVCKLDDLPIAGNAAGNTEDYLDLAGANVSPKPLPAGFQAKGMVALVFSCVAAFLGLAVISWYGMGELGQAEIAHMNKRIAEAHLDVKK